MEKRVAIRIKHSFSRPKRGENVAPLFHTYTHPDIPDLPLLQRILTSITIELKPLRIIRLALPSYCCCCCCFYFRRGRMGVGPFPLREW